MGEFWNPVCPVCSQRVWSITFPGDAGGPIHAEQNIGPSDVVCCNLACRAKVPIDARTLWRRERLWGSPGPAIDRVEESSFRTAQAGDAVTFFRSDGRFSY